MLLRHPREAQDGLEPEDAFEAIEEHTGEKLGSCRIIVEDNAVLYPTRPYSVRLDLEGEDGLEALLGAALARARTKCLVSGKACRIYTGCAPDNAELLSLLNSYGFRDNDGLVRMAKHLPSHSAPRLPAGCVIVRDDLSDSIERKYFIERYNQLFQTQDGENWLREKSALRGFTRFLSVAPTGLAGEIVLWCEPLVGVIGYIQTSRRWRRIGVARYMLSVAEGYFSEEGLYAVQADVRVRIPGLLATLEDSGYHQDKLLMRYPGIEVP